MQTIDLLAWLLEKKLFLTATCLGFPNGCGFFCKPQRGFNVLGSRILLGPCCLSVQGFLQNSYTYKPLILDLLWYSFLIIGENQEQTSKNIIVTEKKKIWEENQQGKSPKHQHFFFRSRATLTWQNLLNYERFLWGQVNFLSCCPWDMGSVPSSHLPIGNLHATQHLRWLFGREIHPLIFMEIQVSEFS